MTQLVIGKTSVPVAGGKGTELETKQFVLSNTNTELGGGKEGTNKNFPFFSLEI